MAKFKKYTFKKHSSKYPELFKREKTKLKKILIKNAQIEHIGSSSVPKLGGKGIIDIIISVPKKEIVKTKLELKKAGYDYKPVAGDKERLFFERIYNLRSIERRVHIHLTYNGSRTWRAAIAIKDYLKKHKKVAENYAKIKKEAAEFAKGGGKKYRKYKKSFLDKIEKKALKNYHL